MEAQSDYNRPKPHGLSPSEWFCGGLRTASFSTWLCNSSFLGQQFVKNSSPLAQHPPPSFLEYASRLSMDRGAQYVNVSVIPYHEKETENNRSNQDTLQASYRLQEKDLKKPRSPFRKPSSPSRDPAACTTLVAVCPRERSYEAGNKENKGGSEFRVGESDSAPINAISENASKNPIKRHVFNTVKSPVTKKKADTPKIDNGALTGSLSDRKLRQLADEFVNEVGLTLREQARRAHEVGQNFPSANAQGLERAFLTSTVCRRLRISETVPDFPNDNKNYSMLRRGFNRMVATLKRGTKSMRNVMTKVRIWLKSQKRTRAGGIVERATKFLRKLSSLAWKKVKSLATRIVAQIIRFMPLILLFINVAFSGMSLMALVAVPNPVTIVDMVSSIINLLAFVCSNGIALREEAFVRQAFEAGVSRRVQTFGLMWADLRAEEDMQKATSIPLDRGTSQYMNGSGTTGEKKWKTEKSASDTKAASFSTPVTDVAADLKKTLTVIQQMRHPSRARVPVQSKFLNCTTDLEYSDACLDKSVPEEDVAAFRRRMKKNLELPRRKFARETLSKIKKDWKQSGWRGLGKIIFNSMRMLLDLANVGVQALLQAFGAAWTFFVDAALMKTIRFLKALKAFENISLFFEQFCSVFRWMGRRVRYYYDLADPFHSLTSFIVNNKHRILSLLHGGMLLTSPSSLLFLTSLIWATSKPLWGWYLTSLGMREASIYHKAKTELSHCQNAFKAFLFGATAVKAPPGGEPLFKFQGVSELQLIDILFVMNYLEQYKGLSKSRVLTRKNITPMESYLLYMRSKQLDEFLAKLSKKDRLIFTGLFTKLKQWKPQDTLNDAHGVLLDTIQLCALKYGKAFFLSNVRDKLKDMSMTAYGISKKDFWAKKISKRHQALIAKRSFEEILRSPNAIFSQSTLEDAARRSLDVISSAADPEFVQWLGSTLHQVAVSTLEKEVKVWFEEGDRRVLDRRTLRVCNIPYSLYPQTQEIETQLRDFFSFNPPLWLRKAKEVDRQLWRTSITRLSTEKGDHYEVDESVRNACGQIAPEVALEPNLESALVRYSTEADTQCTTAATGYFMQLQVRTKFLLTVRRELFKKPNEVCADFEAPGKSQLRSMHHRQDENLECSGVTYCTYHNFIHVIWK